MGFLEGTKILVVDDNATHLRSLERVLRFNGAEVVASTSVEAALEVIGRRQAEFEAAVVDYFLDDGEAAEVIARLRTGAHPCCTLMVTGVRGSDHASSAIAAGADDFLTKPFEVPDFLRAVERTVRRTRAWRARLAGEGVAAVGGPPAFVDEEAVTDPAEGEILKVSKRAGILDIEKCADELTRRGNLSERERNIVLHMLLGRTNNEIARETTISPRTVKFHVANILKKLGAQTRAEVMRQLFTGDAPSPLPGDGDGDEEEDEG